MLEQEFESKKKFLLAKLPDYLKAKGINTESSFSCLNPKDTSHLPSMKYDAATNTVKCFNCNTCYNIFDLIGMDNNLSSFSQQFAKAYELYVGKLPIGFVSILSKLNSEREASFSTENNSPKPYIKEPVFEIADEHQKQNTFIPFGHNDAIKSDDVFGAKKIDESRFGHIEPEPFGGNLMNNERFSPSNIGTDGVPLQRSANAISPFDEARLHPFNARNTVASNTPVQSAFGGFGQAQNIASSLHNQKSPDEKNTDTPKLSEMEHSPFQTFSREDTYDYSAYIKKCCENVGATDYFKERGLSDSIIEKFRLGYDDSYYADGDNNPDSVIWKAAIIPYGTHGYVARNTSEDDSGERFRKKGFFNIYNHETLEQPGTIFITEGEMDALSLETLGMHAIALGGTGNIQLLMESIRSVNVKHHYYICLDNDAAGEEAANKLGAMMFQSGISFNRINLAHPYKDLNEALCSDRDTLSQRLSSLEKMLTLKLDGLKSNVPCYRYINSSEDLSSLRFSPSLYSLSGHPMVLRRISAALIRNSSKKCIYASLSCQRNALESIINANNRNLGSSYSENIRFIEYTKENLISKLITGVGSMIIQGHTDLVTFVDLTSLTEQEAAGIIRKIEDENQVLKVAMVLLCNQSAREAAEGICIQNLNVDISEGGEFTVKTINEQGRPAFFVKTSSF